VAGISKRREEGKKGGRESGNTGRSAREKVLERRDDRVEGCKVVRKL
jgi:hypothetical protein